MTGARGSEPSRWLGEAARTASPLEEGVNHRQCPRCGAFLYRRTFNGRSGVTLDFCALHGSWFERGELARVLAFVDSGALARGLAGGASGRRAESPTTDDSDPDSDSEPGIDADDVISVLDFLLDLLDAFKR